MINVFPDFAQSDEAEIWRRTKRGADEHFTALKGIPALSDAAALASSKRNRSALSNITNGSVRPRSSTRAPQSSVFIDAAFTFQNLGDFRMMHQGDRVHPQSGVYQPSHGIWRSPYDRDTMILSPATSNILSDVTDVLCDGMDTEGAAPLFEQDMEHINDPRYCIEYVDEIFENLVQVERKHLPASDYMERIQSDINQNMRGILIDWLVEVAEEYKLSSENLYLSTNYVDRFLSITPVLRGRLQLVGVAAMLIASKYEEILAPHVDDFVYITDNTYTAHEVRHMETTVLNTLCFNMTAVTPHCFLRRLSALLRMDDIVRHLTDYLSEITLQELLYLKFRPSQTAFSAAVLALHTARRGVPAEILQRVRKHWSLGVEEVQRCVGAMHATHCAIYDKTRTLQASFDKYAARARGEVSLIRPLPTPPLCLDI